MSRIPLEVDGRRAYWIDSHLSVATCSKCGEPVSKDRAFHQRECWPMRTYDKNEHAKELAAAWRAGRFDEVLDTLCGPSRASSAHRCYLAVAVYREIAKHDCVGLSLESRPSVVFLALLDARSRS